MKFTKITISGQICTGKTTLYRALSQQLGWQSYSTGQFFRDYAAKHKLELEAAQEQNASITKKIDYQVRDLLKTKKQIIVEGWMAGIMANDFPGILKVLLICDDSVRTNRFREREQVNSKEARQRVVDRDTSWLGEISKIYGRTDIFDQTHYDLVINTTRLTPSQILQQVLAALGR